MAKVRAASPAQAARTPTPTRATAPPNESIAVLAPGISDITATRAIRAAVNPTSPKITIPIGTSDNMDKPAAIARIPVPKATIATDIARSVTGLATIERAESTVKIAPNVINVERIVAIGTSANIFKPTAIMVTAAPNASIAALIARSVIGSATIASAESATITAPNDIIVERIVAIGTAASILNPAAIMVIAVPNAIIATDIASNEDGSATELTRESAVIIKPNTPTTMRAGSSLPSSAARAVIPIARIETEAVNATIVSETASKADGSAILETAIMATMAPVRRPLIAASAPRELRILLVGIVAKP